MSIPANIAEGLSQTSDKQFARVLSYALNSSSDLEHHLIVTRDLKGISEGEFDSLVSQTVTVRKMLFGLLKRLGDTQPGSEARSQQPLRPKPPAGSPEL